MNLPAWTIEVVDPQHADAIALVHEAAREVRALYPDLVAAGTPLPGNAPAAAGSVYLLLRDAAGRAVASGALRPFDATTAEVRRMFVAGGQRRRGLARAILSALETHARALGYRRLVLETGCRQVAAIALYASAGFTRIAAFGPYADDPTSVCFEKPMTTP